MPEASITPTANIPPLAWVGAALRFARPFRSGEAVAAAALPGAACDSGMIQPGTGMGAAFFSRDPQEVSHPFTRGGAGS
jgi:hypothetical protein